MLGIEKAAGINAEVGQQQLGNDTVGNEIQGDAGISHLAEHAEPGNPHYDSEAHQHVHEHAVGRQSVHKSSIGQAGGNQDQGDQHVHLGQVIHPVALEEKRIARGASNGKSKSCQRGNQGQKCHMAALARAEHQESG